MANEKTCTISDPKRTTNALFSKIGLFFVLWFKNDPVIMRLDCAKERYKPVPQFSQCTRPISPNAPFCNRKVHTCAHFCHKMVHCVIFVGYNSGFVRCVYFFISVFFNWVIAVFGNANATVAPNNSMNSNKAGERPKLKPTVFPISD